MAVFTKQRLFVAIFAMFIISTILYISRNKSDIMEGLQTMTIYMRSRPYSPVLMTILISFSSVPPLLGFNLLVTMSGFIYGFPGGCIPATLGAFIGAMISFVLVRKVQFSNYFQVSRSKQEKLEAVQSAISQGGFRVLLLIRICPIPWQLSNLMLSSCKAVSWKTYMLSALIASFKINWEVWVGSQLANISDPNLPEETRRIAFVLMLSGLAILCLVGVWVYRLTMQKFKESSGTLDEERALLLPNHRMAQV